jgi:hypothetical protein
MKTKSSIALAALCVAAALPLHAEDAAPKHPLGYQDTPLIPGTNWHVHDGERPQPRIVTPGEKPGDAPSDAVVLFDGKDLSKWKMEKDGGEAAWKVEDGYAEVVPKTGYMVTKEQFGPDFQLHVEWAEPNPPQSESQGRGNSGVFLFGIYEIQVLDCYENKTYPDGQTGSIYAQKPPLVNACRPPGQWQSYDIICEGPRFNDDGTVAKKMIVTVLHNGVVVQNHYELIGQTQHKKGGPYVKHPLQGPIKLQDHGNPVRFRNIWIRELKSSDVS